ncbi:MAG: GAP family protein [Candidatus Nanopelagicales bacterium]|nr:GAP family protein [Candidatus Nanopelagicales bacterium]
MLSLLASIGFLGLAAVDPVGIAVMPVLLTQPNGIRRSVWFLLGSAVGITALGIAFAVGAGHVMLRLTKDYPWLEPGIEIASGVVFAGFGLYLWWQQRHGDSGPEVSDSLRRRLNLGGGKLFGFGAGLVIVQSLLDVVFIVAMVNVGAKNLPVIEVLIAVLVYAVAALLLQMAIVAAYSMVGRDRRAVVADSVSGWLDRYGARAAVIASIGVGLVLIASGVSALNGGPSLG